MVEAGVIKRRVARRQEGHGGGGAAAVADSLKVCGEGVVGGAASRAVVGAAEEAGRSHVTLDGLQGDEGREHGGLGREGRVSVHNLWRSAEL